MSSPKRVIERLMERVVVSDVPFGGEPCWVWTGAGNGNGYGRAWDGRGTDYTHRIFYRALVESIPPSLHIDHLCSTKLCCNPAHLEAVAPGENSHRYWNAMESCGAGHKWTARSTYITKEGRRKCRTCHAQKERERRQAGRSASASRAAN